MLYNVYDMIIHDNMMYRGTERCRFVVWNASSRSDSNSTESIAKRCRYTILSLLAVARVIDSIYMCDIEVLTFTKHIDTVMCLAPRSRLGVIWESRSIWIYLSVVLFCLLYSGYIGITSTNFILIDRLLAEMSGS